MAGEHTLIFETEIPIPFTVASAAAIEKGTLLTLSDFMTAAATTAKEAICAGVAAKEKVAAARDKKISVYRRGIFKGLASGSITVGDALITSTGGGNELETAGTSVEDIVGVALETADDTHTFLYELNPITINVA